MGISCSNRHSTLRVQCRPCSDRCSEENRCVFRVHRCQLYNNLYKTCFLKQHLEIMKNRMVTFFEGNHLLVNFLTTYGNPQFSILRHILFLLLKRKRQQTKPQEVLRFRSNHNALLLLCILPLSTRFSSSDVTVRTSSEYRVVFWSAPKE